MTVGFVCILTDLVMYSNHPHAFHQDKTIVLFNVYVDTLFIFHTVSSTKLCVIFIVCIALYGMCVYNVIFQYHVSLRTPMR